MKAILKRLTTLEVRCGLGPETEEQRRSRERFQKFRERLAAYRVSKDLPPKNPNPFNGVDTTGMTMSQMLRLRYSQMRRQQAPEATPDS